MNINLDLAVFWGSAYTMDDEDFIRQFSGLKKIGVKNIIDFHAGCLADKKAGFRLIEEFSTDNYRYVAILA